MPRGESLVVQALDGSKLDFELSHCVGLNANMLYKLVCLQNRFYIKDANLSCFHSKSLSLQANQ